MTLRLAILALAAGLLGAALAPARALAADASAWEAGHHSRVRLVAGGAIEGGARRLAGVEIRLDPGYKTYWRNPGDAGLPPTFDWTGSRNLRAVEIAWPAPVRLDDPGGVSFGYKDGVLLPLKVTPERPGEPVDLQLALHFGVCRDICIPAQARLRLPLRGEAAGHAAPVAEALARVPRRGALGEGALAVTAVAPEPGRLRVAVRHEPGAEPQLFAEAPEGWYLGAPIRAADGTFEVEIAERPRDAAGPVALTFTLVAGEQAVETGLSLDAGQLSR